jgi:transcriptional regulator with XRE-family HTH domain
MRKLETMRRTTTTVQDVDLFADLRELEALRQVVRRELRVHGGQRTLAREIGIDRGSLRKFATGQSTPTGGTLARIQEWAGDRPGLAIPLSLVALALLVDDVSPAARPGARRQLAALLGRIYDGTGEGVPTWVGDEVGGGDPLALAPTGTPAERALLSRIRELVLDYAPVHPPCATAPLARSPRPGGGAGGATPGGGR